MLAVAIEAQSHGLDPDLGRRALDIHTHARQPVDHPAGWPKIRPSASLDAHVALQRCGCGGACCDADKRMDLAPRAAGPMRISRSDDPLESDAEQAAAHAGGSAGAAARARPSTRSAGALARQGAGRSHPPDPVEEARGIAWGRVFRVYARLSGLGPSPPPEREEAARMQQAAEQLELRNLARTIFNWENPNMGQITEIVGSMRDYLGPGLKTVRAPASDRLCGIREAYVIGHSPPIHLCPSFYSAGRDRQAETLIHEAAHLAGIGQPEGESYCDVFDCQTSCGGFTAADSWAHFIHCASGQAPQQPDAVTGHRPRAGRTP